MAVRIHGNREIKTLPGEATRPTSSRVREALFNIWQGRILSCQWLDLCAGSGAMGAEALCRGAASVVGVERSSAACKLIKENWQKVAKPEQQFEIIRASVVQQVDRLAKDVQAGVRPPFDCVYFDPPYKSGLYDPVLNRIADSLATQAEVAVEYSEKLWRPAPPASLKVIREKRYGSTQLLFLASVDS